MSTVNVTDVNNTLVAVLGGISGLSRSYSYHEMPVGMNDLPALEVYPDNGDAKRHAFQKGVYINTMTFSADLYITERSNLPDDMKLTVPYIDAVTTVLENNPDLRGTVKDIWWNWERGTLGPRAQRFYAGLRFTITVEVF